MYLDCGFWSFDYGKTNYNVYFLCTTSNISATNMSSGIIHQNISIITITIFHIRYNNVPLDSIAAIKTYIELVTPWHVNHLWLLKISAWKRINWLTQVLSNLDYAITYTLYYFRIWISQLENWILLNSRIDWNS